jgi:23S rRNA pseudouridine2605 synthase
VSEKLQKVLARAGFGSRRQLEEWIREGRVKINNQVATLGDRVEETDRIQVDGKPVHANRMKVKRTRVLVYHKPVGEVCTASDPEGRPTIFRRLPKMVSGRWIAVGRLDINTSGLLLLTTDGELANKLMHPSQEIEREYAVRVLGEVEPAMLKALQEGVELEDGPAHFDTLRDAGGEGANHWYHVTLLEGRNREVRRLWESQGLQVSRLMRVRFGPITLPKWLKPGRWEEMGERDVNALRQMVGLAAKPTRRDRSSYKGAKPPKTKHGAAGKSGKRFYGGRT